MKEADLIILWIIQDGSACGRRCAVITDTKAILEKSMADGCVEKMDKEFILWILKNGRSQEKKKGYKQVSEHYPDKFIQVRNRRQLRAAVIRLYSCRMKKGLYAGTGEQKKVKKEELLIERLKKYRKSDMYPFHMPGHKRAKELNYPFQIHFRWI